MNETLEKIRIILEESKTLALVSKKNIEDYKLLAKEALKNTFLRKDLKIISLPDHPEFQKKWKTIIPDNFNEDNIPVLQQTSIRIPKNQHKIKEVRYENDENFLSLILTSSGGEISKNIVTFEPVLPKADAVFCFFDPHEYEALQEIEKMIILPPKEKIIFFTSDGITLSEKMFKIIKTVIPGSFPSTEISTLLFASLIIETGNFLRPINQEVLRFGSELLSLGADKESIKTILKEEKTISSARLLGRALARTHIDENSPASWTFLSQKDFEKTENPDTQGLFSYNILQDIRENIPYRPLSLLFWQIGQNVYATAAADEEKKIIPLAEAIGTNLQSRYFTVGPFNNFSEAEMRFRRAIKEMSSLKI